MGEMKISTLDFAKLLPTFMRDDEAVVALSKAVDELLGNPGKRLRTLETWDKIEELTEAECDEMAWELDVDWYDSEGMSLAEKRNTIRLAQQIKRKRGTKWAVEQLITAHFGEGYVVEWYDMDGSPYTFAALTTNAAISPENLEKFTEAVKAAKNERSQIAGVYYFWPQGPDPGVECRLGTKLHRYEYKKCGTAPKINTIGFLIKPSVQLRTASQLVRYQYKHANEITCGTYPSASTKGWNSKHTTAAAPLLHFSAYKLIKCGTKHCGE